MEHCIKIYEENYNGLPQRFINKIESDIRYLLDSGIPELKGVYLFGSCSRDDIKSTSDVDLLVYTEHKIKDRSLAADIRCTLEDTICGVKTDVVFMNTDSINENTVFKNSVNRDKKIIVEVIDD